MTKTILLITLLSISFIYADDNSKTNEDLLKQILLMDKKIEQTKEKTKQLETENEALKELEKSVDNLANTLQVDK